MTWQPSVYSLSLALAALVSVVLACLAWRRRDEQGSLVLLVLMSGCSIWAFGAAGQLLTTDRQLKLLFRAVGFLGHNIVPVVLLVFALTYIGRTQLVTRRNIALLAAEPMLVAFVVAPTNLLGWHTAIWRTISLSTVDQLVVLERSFGAWYWVNTAYNYVLVLVALYLFLYLVMQSHAATRKQGLALIAGVIPPLFANVAWVVGVSPFDLTPIAFTVTGTIFAVAIYRYRLFDIVPVARKTVLDAVDDGYIVLDQDDTVTDINASARQLAAGVDSPIGQPIQNVLPQCVSLIEEHKSAAVETEGQQTVTENISFVGPASDPLYFEVRVSTIKQSPYPGRLVLLRDITEQRTVEQRYQALIENASDLVTVIDDDGYFTYHSPSSARILGYDPEELVGEPITQFIHPDDQEAVLDKFERSVSDPDYQPAHEYRFQHSDGTWLWLESRGRNQLAHPVIEGIVVNSREVTDRKKQQELLRQQNEQLQSLASTAAHDLRNPLQVITGHLPLAQETGDQTHFTAIENATDRMETLVEDIIQIAKAGDFVEDVEPVDIAAVAQESWDGIDTKDAALVVEFEHHYIQADRSKLRSLFENLFTNAIAHGGADVTTRVGTTQTGFYVEDDGDGISENVRPQIFERGLSTDSHGSGLGLTIVQNIVTAHGWDITLSDHSAVTRFETTGVDRISSEAFTTKNQSD